MTKAQNWTRFIVPAAVAALAVAPVALASEAEEPGEGAGPFRLDELGAAFGLSPFERSLVLLAAGMICVSGMIQLAVALGTVTLVAVTKTVSIEVAACCERPCTR